MSRFLFQQGRLFLFFWKVLSILLGSLMVTKGVILYWREVGQNLTHPHQRLIKEDDISQAGEGL